MADRVEGTIGVTVNGREWTHVASFENARPTDTVFITKTEDGITSIIFGDGTHGALPPWQHLADVDTPLLRRDHAGKQNLSDPMVRQLSPS